MKYQLVRSFVYAVLVSLCLRSAAALSPKKSFEQYSRTVWSEQQGLPQDTITAMVQTSDGYLWLGTNEGLARFDGYEFVVFDKARGDLPSNTIKALTTGPDGVLWAGTSSGLVQFAGGKIRIFTTANGLPNNAIDELCVDHAGNLWIAAGGTLARYDGNRFTAFVPGRDIHITVRTVYEDSNRVLWVAGLGGVVKREGNGFVAVVPWNIVEGNLISHLTVDRQNNLWVAGSSGILKRSPDGSIQRYTRQEGLPDNFVRTLWFDGDGNLWAGTNSGLARLQGDRFKAEGPSDLIRCLFEDTEHDLWVGTNDGLSRLRDNIFTVYGTSEGLPSDSPNTVFQDRDGRIWVGYHDNALLSITPSGLHVFTKKEGFPGEEVFSIRQSRSGDLLLSTRAGFVRKHGDAFYTYVPPDQFRRKQIFDALEDSSGRIWMGLPNGLGLLQDRKMQLIIPGGSVGLTSVVTLHQSSDGALWAGTYEQGLWRVQGEAKRHFTSADGLSSDKVRYILQDSDGTLWIATFGGGLNALRGGKFTHFTTKDGLLSDNISSIVDDGESFWLGTTRGICKVSKKQLAAFANKKIARLTPTNYGVEDGLRSAQAAPGVPVGRGGIRDSDGRLWFPTSKGIAVIDPHVRPPLSPAPTVHLSDFIVDGKSLRPSGLLRIQPDSSTVQIRYVGIHLSAPERVDYYYKLDGVDETWIHAGRRREINYSHLAHGEYSFSVRAELPSGLANERTYHFEKLPTFYETTWFRLMSGITLLVAAWGIYQIRVRQLRYRFALVLDERTRIAREIHDTLAQGFVGISSQLEALSSVLPKDGGAARRSLDLARRMARHSITEARRAISDLRGAGAEGCDLVAAIRSGAHIWTAGTGLAISMDVSESEVGSNIPDEFQRHLLRITQEAVTNIVKHASATKVSVRLNREATRLHLQILDDGEGFQKPNAISPLDGHFGLIGMRERTERLGGEFRLESQVGQGTLVDVTVPLP